MAGWDDLNKQAGAKTTTSKGGGWEALNAAAKPVAKQMNIKLDQERLNQEAAKANSFGGILSNTLKELPQQSGIAGAFKAGIDQTKQGFGAMFGGNQSLTQRGEGLLNAGAGVVNTAFSPLAPIFAPIGKGIQYAGDKLANTGYMENVGRGLAETPGKSTPERILEATVNASTIGGAVAPLFKSPKLPSANALEPIKASNVPVKSMTPEVSNVPISTPTTRLADYSRTQGYEPYVAPEQLPSIQMEAKPQATLPSIQMDAPPVTKRGSLSYEPVTAPKATTPVAAQTSPEIRPVVRQTAPPGPVTGSKASKVGSSIEAKAVEKGLTKGFDGVAGYDPITIKDQAARAASLMERDIKLARKMVKGEVPMEKGLRGEMLIKAMEDQAVKTGDASLLRDIAQSPLTSETSAHAQAMRILAERNPDSPVTVIRDLQKARIKKAGGEAKVKKATQDTVRGIKDSIRKTSANKETWASFIDSITC